MTEHRPSYYRTSLGRSIIAGPSGTFYGSVVRCSCGWRYKINQAPSKGGRKITVEHFEQHLKEVS